MKFMRLAMCVAAFAVIGKVALSEDVDVRALQAKLAAQEARLADLQSRVNYNEANANYAGAPEAIVSLNKNACVTIGGNLNTRYFYRNAKIDSIANNWDVAESGSGDAAGIDNDNYIRRARVNQSDLVIADAKVYVQIDVNDYFDAFIQMDLHSSNEAKSDNAEKYYVRWKNVCNSGFGVKVGRDALVFGEDQGMGILGSYTKNGDGAFKDAQWGTYSFMNTGFEDDAGVQYAGLGRRGSFGGGLLPLHNYWDQGRIIQVTPYWEGLDGKLKIEASFFQEEDNWSSRFNNGSDSQIYLDGNKYKNRNYGFGSMSARIGYMPIEGLKFSASVVNFYDKNPSDSFWAVTNNDGFKKNNTAVDLAIAYRPAFFNRLNVWAQFMHGWNVNHLDDVDAWTLSYGASFDLNESWSIFAQGDYLRSRDTYGTNDFKDTAWAVYGGVKYVLPYGVNLEAGWKHEQITWKSNGNKQAKGKGDTAYVHLGFDF